MSKTMRIHTRKRKPTRPEMVERAMNRAVDRMAAGIADEAELEEILAKASPATRAQVRERLEAHLTFRRAHPLVTKHFA